MIPGQAPKWTEADAINWNQFLATPTGQKLFPVALEDAPSLLPNGEANAICIRTGEVRGWGQLASVLTSLVRVRKERRPIETQTTYPDPENDSAWPKP